MNITPEEAQAAHNDIQDASTKARKVANTWAYYMLLWGVIWTACLAEKDEDFRKIVSPAYHWMNATPTRVPLTDWYETTDGKQVGFQARSVVGGLFIPLLRDAELWKKWASRAGKAAN